MCYPYFYRWEITPPIGILFLATVQFLLALGSLIWLFGGSSNTTFGQLNLTIIISTFVNLLIPLVLVTAVLKKEKATRILFLRIWLSWEVAYLLYLLISLVYVCLFQWEYQNGEGLRYFVLNGITFFFHCFFLYTIFNYYEMTMLQKEEPPTRVVIHTEI